MTEEAKGTTKRLYVVTEGGAKEQIIEASSQAQAIKKVVEGRFTAKPATARDVQAFYEKKE